MSTVAAAIAGGRQALHVFWLSTVLRLPRRLLLRKQLLPPTWLQNSRAKVASGQRQRLDAGRGQQAPAAALQPRILLLLRLLW